MRDDQQKGSYLAHNKIGESEHARLDQTDFDKQQTQIVEIHPIEHDHYSYSGVLVNFDHDFG